MNAHNTNFTSSARSGSQGGLAGSPSHAPIESGAYAAGTTLSNGLGRLLTMADVERETSLHRATIYRRIAAGTFPKPKSLGAKRIAFTERDIEAWKNGLPDKSCE